MLVIRGVDWMNDITYDQMFEIISALRDYYPSTYEEIIDLIGEEE